MKIYRESFAEGVYGEVKKCVYRGKKCAFKKFKDFDCSTTRELATYAIMMKNYPDQIAHVYGYKIKKDCFGIAMEMATCSLYDLFDKGMMWKNRELKGIVEKSEKSLTALHQCGIIHCDIKPANILIWIDDDKVVKAVMADFGISSSSPDEDFTMVYTPTHRAPEVWLRNQVGSESDIWALGISFVDFMISDYTMANFQHLKNIDYTKITERLKNVYPLLKTFSDKKTLKKIQSMVEIDPEKRYKLSSLEYPTSEMNVRDTKKVEKLLRKHGGWIKSFYGEGFQLSENTYSLAKEILRKYMAVKNSVDSANFKLCFHVCMVLASEWGEQEPIYLDDYFVPYINIDVYTEIKMNILIALNCRIYDGL